MKNFIIIALFAIFCTSAYSQNILFHENFESPSLGDSVSSTGTPSWAINTNYFNGGLKSFSNQVQVTNPVYLVTNSFSTIGNSNVILQFSHICKIEFGDSAIIEVSVNGGASWIKLTGVHYQGTGLFGSWGDRFSAASYAIDWDAANVNTSPTNSWWKSETFDISSIAANQTNVKVRFKLIDGLGGLPGAGGAYGWILDDIKVLGAISELIPPTITLNSPILQDTIYGTGPFTISANITDASGISQAKLVYWINSGNPDTLSMTNTGSNYSANVPSLSYNNKVFYYVYAIDATLSANKTQIANKWFYNKKGPSNYLVGTGTTVNTSTTYPAPYSNYYGGAKHQMLIRASELSALGASAGPITSIGFYVSSLGSSFTGSLSNFQIDLANTSNTVLSSSSFISGLTNVFPASTIPIVVGLNNHTFATPFIWDGISNIVIQTSYSNANSGTTTDAVIMFNSDPGFVSTNYYRADGVSAATILSYATPYGSGNARPNMKISMLANSYQFDAGVFQIIEPANILYTSASSPIKISIKNYGTDTLKKATVGWSVDGIAQANAIWTGSMLQDVSSSSFTVGNFAFPVGAHTIKIWTKLPNDSNDLYKNNDTMTRTFMVCSGIMTGNYTIGGSGANFSTISAAINQLNLCGVGGPVTFNIAPGTYTEQLDLIGIPGMSAINTVTLQSANGDSTSVIIQWNTETGNNFVMRWKNCQYFNINKLTLKSIGTTNGRVVDLTAGASYNKITNCEILVPTGTVSTLAGIYMSGTANHNNTIKNNRIINGYYGIYLYGVSTSALTKGIKIENNKIENPYYYGIYTYYMDSLIIKGNKINKTGATSTLYGIYSGYSFNNSSYISNNFDVQSTSTVYGLYGYYNQGANYEKNELNISTTGTVYALYPYYNSNGASIIGNKINVNSTGSVYALYDYYTTAGTNPILIANNFIAQTGGTTNTVYGAYFAGITNTLFYHNSINILGGSTTSSALYVSSGTGLFVKNNIISNSRGGYAYYVSTIAAISSSDYNDLYTSGTNIGYWSSAQTTLAAWKTASSKDTNSISVIPNFTTGTNLHTVNLAVNNLGTPVSEVTTDIDGETRSLTTPDMGADEFTPPSNDAGLLNVASSFISCSGSNAIALKVKNGGLNNLTSVILNWSVNGILQTPTTIQCNLATGIDSTISIGNYSLTFNTAYNFKFWVSSPNGVADQYSLNDTIFLNNVYPKLTGNYTIGSTSSNFTSISAAATYLNNYGVCGPVVFTIDNGTYNESVTLGEIVGASYANTITFKPASGANVEISNSASFTLKLAGSDYVTFDGSNNGTSSRNMTIKNTSTSTNTAAIWISSLGVGAAARENTIKNCIIEGGSNNANSSFGIYIAGTTISNTGSGAGNNAIYIFNNQIQNAWWGIYARGTTATNVDTLTIDKNEIGSTNPNKNISTIGIELQAVGISIVSNNNIFNLSTSTANHLVGIQLIDYVHTLRVFNNKVHNFTQTNTTAGYASIGINVSGANNSNIDIYNNMVWGMTNYGSTSTYYNCGIRVNGGTNHKIIYNSVNLYGNYLNNTTSSFSAAFSIGAISGIDVRNNNFSNKSNGFAGSKSYVMYAAGTTNPFGTIGFNNYDTTATQSVLGYFNGADKADLTAWKTSITNDTASASGSSGFYSNDNLHSFSNVLNGMATPLMYYAYDIDGDLRNATTPDVGADEFNISAVDAGVLAMVIPPNSCPGSTAVSARLKNFGSSNLDSVWVNWSINGVTQTSMHFISTLIPYSDTLLSLGNFTFNPNTAYALKFWSSNPNGTVDGNTVNDTLVVNNYFTPLSAGNYSIGAINKDFSSPAAAANYISTYGICGPIVFNIDTGTYVGQVIINAIPGSSTTNTITFQSANLDSNSVVLTYTPTSTTHPFTYTIFLNGAKNVTIKNLTLKSDISVVNVGRVVGIGFGADNNVIKNNKIVLPIVTGNNVVGIFKNQSTTDNFNTIDNNLILGGTNGINYSGVSATVLDKGTIIRNNIIKDFFNNGINISFQDSLKIQSNIIESGAQATTPTGINMTSCNNFNLIEKNKIHIIGSAALVNLMLTNCNATATLKSTIANNYISSVGASGSGISINNSSYQDIVFNSTNTNLSANASYAFYINGGGNNNILNNNFVHPNNGYAYYVNTTTSVDQSNYNNIYSPITRFAYWTANRASLTALKNASGKDTNSVSSNPYYVSAKDLYTFDVNLNNNAIPFAGITDDIDGNIRNISTPDIGADEFTPLTKDLQITALTSPVDGCALSNSIITVKVKNMGLDTMSGTFVLGYKKSFSAAIVTENFTSSFNPGQEKIFSFTQNVNLWAYKDSVFQIKTFVAHPLDMNPGNDTIISPVLSKYTPLLSLVNDTVPWNTSKLLHINTSDSIHWFNVPTGGSLIAYGSNYTTPILVAPTTYYLEAFATTTGNINTTIGIGTAVNTSTSYPAPYTNYYGGTKHQMLILASELQALGVTAGNISSIAFSVSSVGTSFTGTLNNFRIDMTNTNTSVLTSSAFITGLTNVFPASSVAITTGWNTHTLSTPFVWDGTSNVLIQTSYSNANTGTSTDGVIMYNTTTSFNSTNYYYTDGATAASIFSATTPSGVSTSRPNIKINGTSITQGCTSLRVPLNIIVTGIPTKDIATDSIILPISACNLGLKTIQVRIKNAGLDTIKGGITLKYMINNNLSTIVSQTSNDTLAPGAKKIISFATQVNFLASNNDSIYNIAVFANIPTDNNQLNDTTKGYTVAKYTPAPPVIPNQSIPYATSTTLLYNTTDSVFWYQDATTPTNFHAGNSYTTPPLYDTTTYFVSAYAKTGGSGIYTIGTGTTNNANTAYPTPYGNYWWGSKEQYLFTASELNSLGITAGNISSIAWDVVAVNSCPGLIDYTIKIDSTSQSALSTWNTLSNTVFYNASYQPVAGWNTHNFSSPFYWNGVSNIIVEACFNNGSYVTSGNASVNQSTTSFVSSISYHDDASGICAGPGTPTTYSQRPNVKLNASNITVGCGSTRSPVKVTVTNIPRNDASVNQILTPNGSVAMNVLQPAVVKITNYGVDTLKKVTINWSSNNTLQTPFIWTGNLASGATSANIAIGNIGFNAGTYSIKVWTSLPNDSIDNFPINDTAYSNVYACITYGTFTIGGASADFPTINSALGYLNGCSLTGPVIFNINPGTYSGQISLGAFSGASSTNTVTFQAANGDSTSVKIVYAASSTADNWVVKLTNTKFVRFNKVTIEANGQTYGYVVHLNGAQYNEFTNCVIKTLSSTSSNFINFYATGSTLDKYNLIKNNRILNGYYSIYLNGSTSARKAGNTIEKNLIQDFYYYGIYEYYGDSTTIIGNTITNVSPATTNYPIYLNYSNGNTKCNKNKIDITSTNALYGIYLYSSGAGCEIIGNQVIQNSTTTNYGIYIYSVTGTASNKTMVYNNMVSLQGGVTSTTYGIYSSTNAYIEVYYNTISLNTGGTSGYCFYSTAGSYAYLKNNAFVNLFNGYAIYISTISAIVSSNFNDLYTNGTNLGYWTSARTSLSAWQTASSMDANSISVAPVFLSTSNLHTYGVDLNAKASPIAAITDDIDGEIRNTTTPDIGADEFTPPSIDAGITSITYPISPVSSGVDTIKVILKNYGLDTLSQVTIAWSVNDTMQQSYAWTGSLPTNYSQIVKIGVFNFSAGNKTIKVWSNSPNNQNDLINYNDTAKTNLIVCAGPMSGIYTIGGQTANFPTITTAVDALKYCGVGGPVVLKLNTGIYNEQFSIRSISGSSATNTVTFVSSTGTPTDVIIQYNANSSKNYTIKLDTAQYIRFRNVSIKALGSTYGRVVEFAGGTKYCIIDSCIIDAPISTASTTAGIYSSTSKDEYNQISNNQIRNGYYGVYFYGVSSTSLELGNLFKGNQITGFYYYGLYLYYQDYLKVSKNNLVNSSMSATCYGIAANYCDNGLEISQNKVILNPSSTAYGIYIYYCDGISSLNGVTSNNFISITGNSSTCYGIYPYYSTYQLIAFNNVNITNGTTSRSVYSYYGSNLVYTNNSFVNTSPSGFAFYTPTTGTFTANYNNYFVNGASANIGYYAANKTTLTDWITATSQDANSVSTDPGYYSNTDLHVTSVGLNNIGIPLNGILYDIDGQPRSSTTPDIGADEFTPQNKDASAFSLTQPIVTYSPVGNSITIQFSIKNFGTDTLDSIPVAYMVGSNPPVSELWIGILPPNSSINFTFIQPFIVTPGTAIVKVYTKLVSDQNTANDTLTFNFTGIPILQLAYSDNYDGPTNYWATTGNQGLWQKGTPSKAIINSANSAPNVWATGLVNQYQINASNECLYSPYFNFNGVIGATLSFKHWYETQANNDGGRIQFSEDGITWTNLGYMGDPLGTNWVSSNVAGVHMWTGNSNGWVTSSYDLSQFDNNLAPVQFRFNFNSNASVNGDGWAIDNFEINIPQSSIDAALDSIISPISTTYGTSQSVTVRIKNYGTTTLNSIPLHYRINNTGAQIQDVWTGSLASGASANHTFATNFAVPTSGSSFTLTARVNVAGDGFAANDSMTNTITINPPAHDAGVTQIIEPVGGNDTTCFEKAYQIKVTVKNFGTDPITSMNIQYSVNGVVKKTEPWTGNLAPGATVNYIFTDSMVALSGFYAICVKTILPNDVITTNDQVCKNLIGKVCIGMEEKWNAGFTLEQNIPNPSRTITKIGFETPVFGTVKFNLTNVLGQTVQTQTYEFNAGRHVIDVNTSKLAEGVYYYSVELEGHRLVKKMIVVK